MSLDRQISVYLAGPINGRADADCIAWRVAARAALADIYAIKDPMDRDHRGSESDPCIAREIVENDKSDIARCRVVLAYFDRPSVGTSMEVLFAWERKIPVHVVNASGRALSPWLAYHAVKVHDTLEAAVAFLRGHAPTGGRLAGAEGVRQCPSIAWPYPWFPGGGLDHG